MQEYTEWLGMTPSQLILEAEAEIKAGISMRERKIRRYLTGFRKYLHDEGYAPTSIKSYMTGVKSFYSVSYIDLPKLPKNTTRAHTLEENNDIPTKEDIQDALKVCDPLEKAIVLVGASSGLSANEICNLKVRDFKRGYDPQTGITTLRLRRQKVEYDFVTFLSTEASRVVLDYLDYRGRTIKVEGVKRREQLEKQRIFSDAGYLFIIRQVPNRFLVTRDEELRKIPAEGILKIYRRISEKARKNTPKGHWNLIRSHNVRKFFNSALLNAGCDSYYVDFWMGHQQDETRGAYFRANPEKLRELYSKNMPYLTIQKELDVAASDEYKRIVVENETLRTETARHVVERSELKDLRDEIEKLKSEKQDMKDSYWEEQAEKHDEKQDVTARLEQQSQEIDELRKIIDTLTGGAKRSPVTPTKEEKKLFKKSLK